MDGMSDEPKKRDPVSAHWRRQRFAVVSLEVKPKAARSLKNAARDIGLRVVSWAAIFGGGVFLNSVWHSVWHWRTFFTQLALGAFLGVIFGIEAWLQRPTRDQRGEDHG
jgi:hypothetical protein